MCSGWLIWCYGRAVDLGGIMWGGRFKGGGRFVLMVVEFLWKER